MSKENFTFPWCKRSDQPAFIRDKAFKRRFYRSGLSGTLKIIPSSLILPFTSIILGLKKRIHLNRRIDNIGVCVNLDYPLPEKRSPTQQELRNFVEELDLKNILIRIPLSDIDNIEKYFAHIEHFQDKDIVVNILQDRKHIEDLALARESLNLIFKRLSPFVKYFQIGNSINRIKWAFASPDEYFAFFSVAQKLKRSTYKNIQLLGGNVIDFELPYLARALFNFWPIRFDAFATQLYVDRRGAPENTQFGCDTVAKINWFSLMLKLSTKSSNSLWITEVNWPIVGTGEFAPAKGPCMATEVQQRNYLARYYLLMFASGKVARCYWHQLIAPGYGLIDNLGNELRKREAYYALKTLLSLFSGAVTRSYSEDQGLYSLSAERDDGFVQALWRRDGESKIKLPENYQALDILGRDIKADCDTNVTVSENVIYLVTSSVSLTSH